MSIIFIKLLPDELYGGAKIKNSKLYTQVSYLNGSTLNQSSPNAQGWRTLGTAEKTPLFYQKHLS